MFDCQSKSSELWAVEKLSVKAGKQEACSIAGFCLPRQPSLSERKLSTLLSAMEMAQHS